MESSARLQEFSLRMDWKDAAGLAAITAFVGVVLIPALLGTGPVLRAVGIVLAQFAWLTTFVFAFIAVVRFRDRPRN